MDPTNLETMPLDQLIEHLDNAARLIHSAGTDMDRISEVLTNYGLVSHVDILNSDPTFESSTPLGELFIVRHTFVDADKRQVHYYQNEAGEIKDLYTNVTVVSTSL